MMCCAIHCSPDPSVTKSGRFSKKRAQLQENIYIFVADAFDYIVNTN